MCADDRSYCRRIAYIFYLVPHIKEARSDLEQMGIRAVWKEIRCVSHMTDTYGRNTGIELQCQHSQCVQVLWDEETSSKVSERCFRDRVCGSVPFYPLFIEWASWRLGGMSLRLQRWSSLTLCILLCAFHLPTCSSPHLSFPHGVTYLCPAFVCITALIRGRDQSIPFDLTLWWHMRLWGTSLSCMHNESIYTCSHYWPLLNGGKHSTLMKLKSNEMVINDWL